MDDGKRRVVEEIKVVADAARALDRERRHARDPGGGRRIRRAVLGRGDGGKPLKLVTFGEELRVGVLDGDEIGAPDVSTMREYFERGGAEETGERVPLAETRLRAPSSPRS